MPVLCIAVPVATALLSVLTRTGAEVVATAVMSPVDSMLATRVGRVITTMLTMLAFSAMANKMTSVTAIVDRHCDRCSWTLSCLNEANLDSDVPAASAVVSSCWSFSFMFPSQPTRSAALPFLFPCKKRLRRR